MPFPSCIYSVICQLVCICFLDHNPLLPYTLLLSAAPCSYLRLGLHLGSCAVSACVHYFLSPPDFLAPQERLQAAFVLTDFPDILLYFACPSPDTTISPRNTGPFIMLLETKILEVGIAHGYWQHLGFKSSPLVTPRSVLSALASFQKSILLFCFMPTISSWISPQIEPEIPSTNHPLPSFPILSEYTAIYTVSQGKALEVICSPQPCNPSARPVGSTSKLRNCPLISSSTTTT